MTGAMAHFLRRRGDASRPPLSLGLVLAWADAHRARTGRWPTASSGPAPGAGLTWRAVNQLLRRGVPGLPRGGSLPSVVWRYRGGLPAAGPDPGARGAGLTARRRARDAALRRERAGGAALAFLAGKYGISRQRVQQIVGRRPPPGGEAGGTLGNAG